MTSTYRQLSAEERGVVMGMKHRDCCIRELARARCTQAAQARAESG